MEARELRIGNMVYRDGQIVTVQGFYKDHEGIWNVYYQREKWNGLNPIDRFKPIPISKEDLLKCGFKHRDDVLELQILEFCVIDFSVSGFICDFCAGQYIEGDSQSLNIKYFHQIQNLYFALKGEELNLK